MDRVSEILYLYEDDVESFADGGRIGFKRGKRAPGERRMYAGRMMTEDQIEALKERRLVPKQEGMTWDKKTKSFKPRKDFSGMSPQERKEKFTAPKAAETKKLKATKKLKDFVEKFKLENDGKLPTQQQIMKAVGGKSETVQKYLTEGVDYAKRVTKQEAGKLAGKQFGDLTEEAQIAIKEHFHDVDIDFSKNADGTYVKGKYGIAAGGRGDNKALYEQIRRFAGTPEEWKYAYNLGAADGWLLSQMDRAGYEPIYETIKGNKKIIGHIDPDGNKYYGAKKWADKYNGLQVKTSHPDYKETEKLVDITKKTRTLPNQAIQDILTKGGVPVDSRLQLNHLLNYLIDEKGVDVTRSALEKHHVRGVKRSPTKDLQLVTRIANAKANKIRNEIQSKVFDRIDVDERLKKLGITLDVDGARYGGPGFKSIEEVEGFVEKGLKKFDETKFEGLRQALVRSGIPCKKGAGGQCTSVADYQKGYNQIVEEAADGSKDAIKKLGKFTKAMRGITNVGKWTGYGLLAEAGFMVPFAVGDYAAGKSWKRILGNATDYGFGPILGQSEQEEFEAALPEGSKAVEGEKAWELSEQLRALDEQTIRPQGRIGMDQARREKSRENVITGIEDEFKINLDPFLSDTPWAKDQWNQGMWSQAHQDAADAREAIALQDAEREEKRNIAGEEDFYAAGGGIASIRRPGAIPPESGPQPQGLENLKYYVTNT
jgi:hypothetical protein